MENKELQSENISEQSKKHDKNSQSKKGLYIALAVIIVAGAVVGMIKLKQKQDADRKANSVSITGAKQEIDNTTEEEKVLQAQIENYKAQIKQLSAGGEGEEKLAIYSKLAAAQYRLGQYDNALSSLDEIVEQNDSNHRIWALYTNIYWDMGNLPKARESSKKALDLDNENPQSWLAFIELQEDQSKENIDKQYQEALKKTDTFIDIVIAYARFLEKQGDKAGAIAQWQSAGRILPNKKAEYDAEIGRLQQ